MRKPSVLFPVLNLGEEEDDKKFNENTRIIGEPSSVAHKTIV